jgi:phosphoglycerate kinase
MEIRNIGDMPPVAGKYVLVRDDFNVQIVDGKIADAFRIGQSLPTLRRLAASGARLVVIAHLGRPKDHEPELSLRPVAAELEKLLGRPVRFVGDCLRRDFLPGMNDGDVALLENLRYCPGEEKNDPIFAQRLAAGMDFYVNDAFAVSHRRHASVDAVARILPPFAGELLSRETAWLTRLLAAPKRPLVGLLGSGKVSSKVGVIKALAKLCDRLIVGGGIGTCFRIALGAPIKDMLWEPDLKDAVLEIMRDCGDKIILPVSKGVGREFRPDAARADKMLDDIAGGDIIMDEGPESVAAFEAAIGGAATVVWNGTVGMAEWQPNWSYGSFALARFVAGKTARGEIESIVGGGDTVAALEAAGVKDSMTYVSTGGGAFLEFIEGLPLPGIEAILNSQLN